MVRQDVVQISPCRQDPSGLVLFQVAGDDVGVIAPPVGFLDLDHFESDASPVGALARGG